MIPRRIFARQTEDEWMDKLREPAPAGMCELAGLAGWLGRQSRFASKDAKFFHSLLR